MHLLFNQTAAIGVVLHLLHKFKTTAYIYFIVIAMCFANKQAVWPPRRVRPTRYSPARVQ